MFDFNPKTGFLDENVFPEPGPGPGARQQFMTLLNQLKDYLNNTVDPALKKKTIIVSRSTNIVGNQVVSLGFTPKFVRIHAALQNNFNYDSDGSFDGTQTATLFRYGTGNLSNVSDSLGVIYLHSGTADNRADCTFTANGITLNWNALGAIPNDVIVFKIDAWG